MSDIEIENQEHELLEEPIRLNGGTAIGCHRYITPEAAKKLRELRARRMINACLAYDHGDYFFNEKTGRFGEYASNYLDKLTPRELRAIWNDQSADFRRRATIRRCVHVDHEGCTYNSVIWRSA